MSGPSRSGGHVVNRDTIGLPVQGLATGQTHRLLVEREAVPILFVPGVMGSRLGANGTRPATLVWDPDDGGFMKDAYLSWNRSRAADKKRLLIGPGLFSAARLDVCRGDETYLARDGRPAPSHAARSGLTSAELARGWGGVFWGSYGAFLRRLAAEPLGRRLGYVGHVALVETPVYAFGYNWTASAVQTGAQLAVRIREIVQEVAARGLKCRNVVLVTHSMGGLVARSACLMHGAAGLVLGVVHAVQPVTGSAAAYWRMKAGFERSWITHPIDSVHGLALGRDGREVTALLGNMPGGLELLPSQNYRGVSDDPQWLHWPEEGGGETRLPRAGDPYASIYREQTAPWRLIEDATWLTPELVPPGPTPSGAPGPHADPYGRHAQPPAAAAPTGGPVAAVWNAYVTHLADAQAFHSQMDERQHQRSVHVYSTGLKTAGVIRLQTQVVRYLQPEVQRAMTAALGPEPRVADACAWLDAQEDNANQYTFWRPLARHGEDRLRIRVVSSDGPESTSAATVVALTPGLSRLALHRPADDGDGTVPVASARALCAVAGTRDQRDVRGVPHQDAFASEDVQHFTLDAIASFLPVPAPR